ncbi:MAG: insulinase family protein [Myxococcales bacterium]|nr:insulinase family protein [Myxococcales bacterium]
MRTITAWLAGLALATALFAGLSSSAEAEGPLENLVIQRHTLSNGLRVVLNPDPKVPTVAIAVYYDVGSRNEEQGRSGFAHLFEHMMFQGSANVGKAEHFTLINSRGGSANGTTSEDRTNYYETLPSNELHLGIWLEADRMRSLAITAENFENQRQTVMEERRQRIDNQPYVPAFLRIDELVYGDFFPYAHSVIGDMEDLQKAPLEAVQAFFDAYYAPNNAVISISGDFDPEEALALVEKEFGSIPSRPHPAYEPGEFTPREGERRETMSDPNAPLPAILMAYPIPPMRTPDHYALEMLTLVLSDGESSRLHQLLVKKKELAAQVVTYTDDRRGPDTFSIFAVAADGKDPRELEAAIDAEIASIAKKGVSARELAKARNRLRAHFVHSLESPLGRAKQLAEHELYWGDATLLRTAIEPYLAVTNEDLKRVAAEYLRRDRRSVIEVRPAEKETSR